MIILGLNINHADTSACIVVDGKIEFAIEQHPSYLKVTPVEEYHKSENELNKKREFWDIY